METTWFVIITLMLSVYVVLDGFDFGAGILHLAVARNDRERRTVLAAIGPVWDGNEVWIIAGGGVLFYSFPKAYAAGFSGFYMPLMIVLWLLILRGLAIEFRSKEENPLWRSAWDGGFAAASVLMAVVLGAALGNVLRGVPLGTDGYFTTPLFTDFGVGPNPGVLDWYTVLVGLFTLCLLAGHGALYLAWKTAGPVSERSRAVARPIWGTGIVLWALATLATHIVRPGFYSHLLATPAGWVLIAIVLASITAVFVFTARGRELPAFLASSCFLLSMLGATATGMYPALLRSTLSPGGSLYDLTVWNARAGELNLRVGLIWWLVAIALAIGYFTYLFRSFRGKVLVDGEGTGY